MAYTVNLSARNALLADIRTQCAGGFARFYTGSRPADPDTVASGTLLAEVTLGSPAFAAPSGGSMALSGVPLEDTSANASGTVGYVRFATSGGAGVADGTVTVTGGGGEVEMPDVDVTATEPFRITSLTITKAA